MHVPHGGVQSARVGGLGLKLVSLLQGRLSRRLLLLLGSGLFRLRFDFRGCELVPRGEPLIVAAAPHRNWIDPFLVIMALPPEPRVYFLASAEGMFNTWWKRAILALLGGVIPVSTAGQLNRQGLEKSLSLLATGNNLGLMPEGWSQEDQPPDQVQPVRRGVAFLAERSGRRVLPVGLSGTQELWRGKTLRLRFGSPLHPPPRGTARADEVAFAERLREALQAVQPPLPPLPEDGHKPWPWLTRLLY